MKITAMTADGVKTKVLDPATGETIDTVLEADTDLKTLTCHIYDPTYPMNNKRLLVSDKQLVKIVIHRSYDLVNKETGEIISEVRVQFNDRWAKLLQDPE
jgi:hypothetical protein